MHVPFLLLLSSTGSAQGRPDESNASVRSAQLLVGWRGGLDPLAVDRELLSGQTSPDPELRERVQQVRLLWDLVGSACAEAPGAFREAADATSAWATVCPRLMFDQDACDPLSSLFAMRSLVRTAQSVSGGSADVCAAPVLARAQVMELARSTATMDWPETSSWFDPRAFLSVAGRTASPEGLTALLDAALALSAAQDAVSDLSPKPSQALAIGAAERACGRELTNVALAEPCISTSEHAAAAITALAEAPGGARTLALRQEVCERYRVALRRANQDPALSVATGLLTLASGTSMGQPACVVPLRALASSIGSLKQGEGTASSSARIWAAQGLTSTLLFTSDLLTQLPGSEQRDALALVEAEGALIQSSLNSRGGLDMPIPGAAVTFATELLDMLALQGLLDPRGAGELFLVHGAYLLKLQRAEVDRLATPEPVVRLWSFDQTPSNEALAAWCGQYTYTQDQWDQSVATVARLQALEPALLGQACNHEPAQEGSGDLLVGMSQVVKQLLKDADLDVDRLGGMVGPPGAPAVSSASAPQTPWVPAPVICDRATWPASHVVSMLAADRQLELIAADARALRERGQIEAANRATSYLSVGRRCEAALLDERQLTDLSAILGASDAQDPELFQYRLERRSVVVQTLYSREIQIATPNPTRKEKVLVTLANDLIARAAGGPFRLAPGSPWLLDGGLAVHVRLPLGVYRVETSAGPVELRVAAGAERLSLPLTTSERKP